MYITYKHLFECSSYAHFHSYLWHCADLYVMRASPQWCTNTEDQGVDTPDFLIRYLIRYLQAFKQAHTRVYVRCNRSQVS